MPFSLTDRAENPKAELLEAKGLSFRYPGGVPILENVSLSVHSGEMIGISGPSGSGKSTLLSILGFVSSADKGELYLQSRRVPVHNERRLLELRREHVGFVFQHFNLVPALTAQENVALPLMIAGNKWKGASRRAGELLEKFGIAELRSSYPENMSGGEKQRVAISRAIAHDPLLIIADEPTGSLDRENGLVVLEKLKSLVSQGRSVVMASHDATALEFCDRVFTLAEGQLTS